MRNLRYGLFAAAIAVAVAGLTGPIQAQPYGYGPGMMGGYGPGPGYGTMGPGYGPGMMGGYGPGYMMGPGYGPGMMGGYGPGYMMRGYGGGYGPGMMGGYGPGYYGNQGDMRLTTDQVKNYLQQMIRNPNLKVGEVKEKNADTIVAEIVTKDKDALVQRVDFNRHNGFIQPEQ
jgi:hypothetical protein